MTRPARRNIAIAVAALLLAAGACTSASPRSIRYDDVAGSSRYPLTADGGYGAGVWTQRLGDPYTASIVLQTSRPVTAHLERVDLVASSPNLEVIGVLAAGPTRHLGQAMGGEGFPPAHMPRSMRTRYWPIDEVPVEKRTGTGIYGVDVIIGLRFQTGKRAWFDGIQVTYSIDGQRYIGRFPVSWGMCRYSPCPIPKIGKPWGDQR